MSNPTMSPIGEENRREQLREIAQASQPTPPKPQKGSTPKPQKAEPTHKIALDTLEDCVEQSNGVMKSLEKGLKFRIVIKAKQLQVEILKKSTGEVLKTIPAHQLVSLIGRLNSAIGMIIDLKA